jgi:hypothetical protein
MVTLKINSARVGFWALNLGLLTVLLIQAVPFHIFAADSLLVNRFDRISNSVAGSTATHTFGFTMANTTQAVGSISFEFCSNTPIPNTACTVPVGFDASSAALASQGGDVGFSIHPVSTSTRIVLTRPPLNPLGVQSAYQFNNIINPSNAGSYYVRLQTYSSSDGTGIDIENGGVVFAINSVISVNAEVPPYIRFCAGVTIVSFDCSTANSFFIDFGELSTTATSKASSQFVVATNAQSGYTVSLSGTTLISGNNVIPAMAVPAAPTIGASQFGINLKANSNPAVGSEVVGPGTSNASAGYDTPDQFKFQNGDTLVSIGNSNSNRKFTVSYITNISPAQQAGVYATTISYICFANF